VKHLLFLCAACLLSVISGTAQTRSIPQFSGSSTTLEKPPPPIPEAIILTKQPILLGPASNALQSATIECASITNVMQTVVYFATNSATSPSFICTNSFTGNTGIINDLPWARLYLFGQSIGSNRLASAINYEGSYCSWGEWPLLAIQISTNSMTWSLNKHNGTVNPPDLQRLFRMAYEKYDSGSIQVAHYQKFKHPLP